MKEDMMGNIRTGVLVGLIMALTGVIGLWSIAGCKNSQPEGAAQKEASTAEENPNDALVERASQPPEQITGLPLNLVTAIIKVANSNIPAVVHIEVTERQEVPNPFLPLEKDPRMRRFFGLPKKMPKKFERELVGVGTGMIMDKEGHILTNNHVVGGANKIQVSLSDGTQYSAKVIGTDPKTDLGVIQISGKDLPCVYFGNSDQVQVGEWVVAIGQPRNLAQSVTQGIVSAKHRTGITNPSSYEDFLQTDAAINPGNSGGPLLNLRGEVIGVNSAILSQSGGFEGIGFAIPSNMAVHVANALIQYGKVERGWLGVNVRDVTPDQAKSLGLGTPHGAFIADVTKGGPADKAALNKGDVVLSYQGKDIPDAAALRNDVANSPVDQEVKITVWRNGKKQNLRVKTGNLEELTKMLTTSLKEKLGVEVRPMTVQEAEQYGMRAPEGVVIRWIDPKGRLGKVGFEVGDIILAVNGHPVEDVVSFSRIVETIPQHHKAVLLAVDHRTGEASYVKVELG
jgi:serine protease Do